MEIPVSPPEFRRTCPACNRPVEPGFKFCEFCGTRIPELSTCSKCGTRFIAPVKYCDLCGAPVILEATPEPDELPKISIEDNTGPAEYETPELDNEEIQGPDAGEFLEYNDEENTGPSEDEAPEHDKEEISEPDTDELLEKYGKGYSDDETLGSHKKQESTSPVKNKGGKKSPVPAPSGEGTPEIVDDALFLSGRKQAPAKIPVKKPMVLGGTVVLVVIIAAVYFIGLPMLIGNGDSGAHSSVTVADITSLPEPTIVHTIPPTQAGALAPATSAFIPQPTQVPPVDQPIFFSIHKDPLTAKISVIFAGSASTGAGSISRADVKVTHPGGAVATGIIMPLKGVTEITLDGSKETDRVEIVVIMTSGEMYRVRDELVPYLGL